MSHRPPKGDQKRGIRPTNHVKATFKSLTSDLFAISPLSDPPLGDGECYVASNNVMLNHVIVSSDQPILVPADIILSGFVSIRDRAAEPRKLAGEAGEAGVAARQPDGGARYSGEAPKSSRG